MPYTSRYRRLDNCASSSPSNPLFIIDLSSSLWKPSPFPRFPHSINALPKPFLFVSLSARSAIYRAVSSGERVWNSRGCRELREARDRRAHRQTVDERACESERVPLSAFSSSHFTTNNGTSNGQVTSNIGGGSLGMMTLLKIESSLQISITQATTTTIHYQNSNHRLQELKI